MKTKAIADWEAQLSLDFCLCALPSLPETNSFTVQTYREGRRIYGSDRCLLHAVGYRSTAFFCSPQERLLQQCRETFGRTDGAWLCELENIRKMDALLRPFGEEIADAHHYYLPHPGTPTALAAPDGFSYRFLAQQELQCIPEEQGFTEALGRSSVRPDMLGCGAWKDGTLIALAGASMDSALLWQIGVDVKQPCRGRGLAAFLVKQLKEELLNRGITPFYGTGESHIVSQKVALRAGFSPVWWEAYSHALPARSSTGSLL